MTVSSLRGAHSASLGALVALVVLAGCAADRAEVEPDLGPIEQTLDELARKRWPGTAQPDGTRLIPRVNGFLEGGPIAYWLIGLAPASTADMYWFCREDDAGCPFDALGRLDLARTVGGPVFARMPGEQSYSTYWWVKVIRVPADYEADAIKSVFGIERALREGHAFQEWFHFDYGGAVGPTKAIEHSVLVLDGTELQGNGDELVGQPGVASVAIPRLSGWHKQYRVQFFDFTATEGVLSPEHDEAPLVVPSADLYMIFRDCEAATAAAVCAGDTAMRGAVSELDLGLDLTGDGDTADTNNLLVPRADKASLEPGPHRGWGLWAASEVTVGAGADAPPELIDTSADQTVSELTSAAVLEAWISSQRVSAPVPLSAARVEGPIPSLAGAVLFDGPLQVAAPPP